MTEGTESLTRGVIAAVFYVVLWRRTTASDWAVLGFIGLVLVLISAILRFILDSGIFGINPDNPFPTLLGAVGALSGMLGGIIWFAGVIGMFRNMRGDEGES
jgi:hypothetical protein